jgi:hypothetical protein
MLRRWGDNLLRWDSCESLVDGRKIRGGSGVGGIEEPNRERELRDCRREMEDRSRGNEDTDFRRELPGKSIEIYCCVQRDGGVCPESRSIVGQIRFLPISERLY